jgi:hypothetical protein
MTMTIDSIEALEPLREQARLSNLRNLTVYVPEDGNPFYEDDSYIFFTEYSDAKWWDVMNFRNLAEKLLGGKVYVMRRNSLDSVEAVHADTNAIPILK